MKLLASYILYMLFLLSDIFTSPNFLLGDNKVIKQKRKRNETIRIVAVHYVIVLLLSGVDPWIGPCTI